MKLLPRSIAAITLLLLTTLAQQGQATELRRLTKFRSMKLALLHDPTLLLDSYQKQYSIGTISAAQFSYARDILCPVIPDPGNMHTCGLTAVGNGRTQSANEAIYDAEKAKLIDDLLLCEKCVP